MSSAQTTPLTEDALAELSAFLQGAFTEPAHQYLFSPEVLRWKYLDPIGDDRSNRSWVVREEGRIVAHLGLSLTRFGTATAAFPYDWIAKGSKSPHGLMLLMRMHRLTEVQYILGCTDDAAQVYARAGYQTPLSAQIFQRVLHPLAWQHIHRRQPIWKKILLLTLDRARSIGRPGVTPKQALTLRPAARFGPEIADLLRQGPALIRSDREVERLNHFLRFPPGTIHGWHLFDRDRLCGFALVNVVPQGPIRLGKVLECWAASEDSEQWQAAGSALVDGCRQLGCHQIAAYGTAPCLASAWRANGFFPRGRTPLQWRDPKGKVPIDRPYHLTYLEADIGLL